MIFLLAHLQQSEDSCWGVSLPALSGCFSSGDTIPEAIENITVAISEHLEILQESGDLICLDTEEIPHPYKLNEIVVDEDNTSHYYALVPIKLSHDISATLLK